MRYLLRLATVNSELQGIVAKSGVFPCRWDQIQYNSDQYVLIWQLWIFLSENWMHIYNSHSWSSDTVDKKNPLGMTVIICKNHNPDKSVVCVY